MNEQWMVYTKRADFNGIASRLQTDPLLVKIMRNRGLEDEEEMRRFLYGDLSSLHDPFLMKDMERAVLLLTDAIHCGKNIRVIGDYDIDGICSSYLLTDGLNRLGAKTDTAIPDRLTDGYGLNERLIEMAYAEGISVIVTCDNGIAAASAVSLAKQYGMTVIVTDHHAIPYEMTETGKRWLLPEADAIVNPKQEDCAYPFSDLCGAAVAWKLVTALYLHNGHTMNDAMRYLSLAGIATIGDVVGLTGENRIIAKYALKVLPTIDNVGIKALLKACGISANVITSYQIGFQIGPCLNASGRLDTALKAVALLRETDPEAADALALELKELNDRRKELTEEQVVLAKEQAKQFAEDDVLVLYLPDCHESIAGIVAGRVREAFYKPTLLFTDAQEGIKGSGRSIEAYDMFEELSKCRDLFTKFGGHKMAAGFSAAKEQLESIRTALNRNSTLTAEELTPKLWIDAAAPFSYFTAERYKMLHQLEPFGKSNEKPVFAQKNVCLTQYRVFGKNRNVIRMNLVGENGDFAEGVMFQPQEEWEEYLCAAFGAEEQKRALCGKAATIRLSVLYEPVWDDYNQCIQMRIHNYR